MTRSQDQVVAYGDQMMDGKENPQHMRVLPDELFEAAKDFRDASADTSEIVTRLEERVRRLENSWSDAGEQTFHRYYREWHTHVQGFVAVLDAIAEDMEVIAQNYMSVDGQ